MLNHLANSWPDGPSDALELAVCEDHERIRVLLSRFREAWLNGHGVRRLFHRLEAAVCRHLLWEENNLIGPVRDRLYEVYEYQVLQRDGQVHRDLRDALNRVHGLLPQRSADGHDTDRKILEHVEKLEALLDTHRSIFEAHVCAAVGELHSRAAQAGLAQTLRLQPASLPN